MLECLDLYYCCSKFFLCQILSMMRPDILYIP